MNSPLPPLRFAFAPPRFPRSVALLLLAVTAGVSLLATADGMTQPDPPVPLEGVAQKVALVGRAPARDLDCRCAVLYARDIESRIEGHVERYEALSSAPAAQHAATRTRHVHVASYVEGMVGFPVHSFRLTADEDDGAGSD